jgi:hypothetical protein
METDMKILHNAAWTGTLGLDSHQIDTERRAIFETMCLRRGLDPHDGESEIGTGYLYTPSEIHREQVLWAMDMANAIIGRGGTRDDWEVHASEYRTQQLWKTEGPDGITRKYGYNRVQNDAYALSAKETDAVWEAQSKLASR